MEITKSLSTSKPTPLYSMGVSFHALSHLSLAGVTHLPDRNPTSLVPGNTRPAHLIPTTKRHRGHHLEALFTEGVSLSHSSLTSSCLHPICTRGTQPKGARTQSFLPKERFSRQSSVGNKGCGGGQMCRALEYAAHTPGVATAASYPFVGTSTDGTCKYANSTVGSPVGGYLEIPYGDEEALKKAVGLLGPIAAGLDGSPESFRHYR
ncbi:cathepsin S [Trichonephila clavipes]|nr:cathepsin S [Trichonephila clavipes]